MRDSSVEMLQVYLTSIIESIVGSVDQCPPVMRVAFKQLHKRVEEQFTEPENEVSLWRRGQRESNSLAAIACLSCSTESSDIPHVQCRRCRSEREGILRLVDLCPLAGVSFAGRQVSGHQRLLFPTFLCAGDPHAQTVPAEGSARRHADQQNAAPAGQGGFHDADADDWIEVLLQGQASPVSVELSREEMEAVVRVCAR